MSLLTRRTFLWSAGAATAGALVLGDEIFIREPRHPQLVRIEIPLPRLPGVFDGFTIAQLSDFHYDDTFTTVPIRAAVAIVNRLQPDLVVLSGDFVTVPMFAEDLQVQAKNAAQTAEPCARLLAQLHSRLGSLAILGNHDVISDPAFVTEALQSRGIQVLCNSARVVEQGGARLWFCGLDSLSRKPRIETALRDIPRDEPVILLVHEPDFADEATAYPVDLQLSGHSHGGQIWLPGIGAPWLPAYARKYPRGRYTVGRLPLYTNIGLGTIRLPVRLNCIPEVTLFTLRAGAANRHGS